MKDLWHKYQAIAYALSLLNTQQLQSTTPTIGGGLWRSYKGLLLPKELALVFEPIQFVLVAYVFFDNFFITAYCAHVISSTPEVIPPVPFPEIGEFVEHPDCCLAF